MITQEDQVTYKGKAITLVGDSRIVVGDKLPGIRLSKSMEDDLVVSELRGRVVVFNVIPSIDTPVCATQTSRFNDEASSLGDGVVLVTVSMDLPFAIRRWCEEQNIRNIVTTSDYKYHDFGRRFGILMRGLGLLARSVYVLDRDGVLRYEQIVPRMEDEPDYDHALDVVRRLV